MFLLMLAFSVFLLAESEMALPLIFAVQKNVLSKEQISPTYRYLWTSEKPVIFNLYHRLKLPNHKKLGPAAPVLAKPLGEDGILN